MGAYYKYGSFSQIARLRAMICKSLFYFASPSQLNDPSDCKNIIQDHSLEEIQEFLIEANRLYYGHSRGDAYIKEGIIKFGPVKLLEEMTKEFNKLMDTRYGVFSLSRRSNNMALWAKYADSYKGYCLEFSDLSSFSSVYEVKYCKKIPLKLKLKIEQDQIDFLFTKSPEWSNEEEARIVSKPHGYQLFPKNALKCIIIGEYCEYNNIKLIKDLVQECNNEVIIKIAKFNTVKQKIEYITVV